MDNSSATQAMLCSAVVNLQRAVADMKKAMTTQQRKHLQRVKELCGRLTALEGAVCLLQLATASGSGVSAAAAAPSRRRKRSETEEEDSQDLTPPRAPKKRRTGSVTEVSFHY